MNLKDSTLSVFDNRVLDLFLKMSFMQTILSLFLYDYL